MNYISPSQAVEVLKSHQRIYIQGTSATPTTLIKALIERAEELVDLEICHLHTEGDAGYSLAQYEKSFKINNFFVGANIRNFLGVGRNQYVPIFLGEIPSLFRKKILPLDAVFIHVSPPDKHGFCSMGTSVEATRAATDTAKIIIAQVNPKMPRTLGDGIIHKSKINYACWVENELFEHTEKPLSQAELAIGKHVSEIIEDGACLQMGIGGIPNAVLSCLGNHKNLGVHTEMFSDGVISLVEKGIINGSKKRTHPGKIVSTFLLGSPKLYEFVNDNQMVAMLDVAYTNDPYVIAKNTKVTAINSAIEIDLSGQVCADSIGAKIFSGVGGQIDFISGASMSKGGKPIIAMTSTTNKGENKIVPILKTNAGVVSTRAHVHYIATEYGIVNLFGKNLAQRAKALISLAHPTFREELEKQAFELYGRVW